MDMSMKTAKKMKGFMCQSPACTAVCMSQDYRRSVVVPGKSDRMLLPDQVRFINTTKYVRLGDRHELSVSMRKPFHVSSRKNEDSDVKHHEAPNSLAIPENVFQVVVMRVSIHCQGCAGKVKKHLSKMKGVTSFSIDLESKRVTVMGHVSPSDVLESISKVKKAEFWPSSTKHST